MGKKRKNIVPDFMDSLRLKDFKIKLIKMSGFEAEKSIH
jgi:hypothetical protein